MKIDDYHMYHGAGLAQIAEHSHFTAINRIRLPDGSPSHSSFLINDGIVVYFKYASEPNQSGDYIFTFTQRHKDEIQHLDNYLYAGRVFIALVCLKDREICCISSEEINAWFEKRRAALNDVEEDESTVRVRLEHGHSFRVNMNMPGRRGQPLDEPDIVSRKSFPEILFEQ